MRPLYLAVLFLPLSLSSCVDVPALRAKAHGDRLVAAQGECRSSGFARGSAEYSRCVSDRDEAANRQIQLDREAAVARGIDEAREYAKESGRPAPPFTELECDFRKDGKYTCVGQ